MNRLPLLGCLAALALAGAASAQTSSAAGATDGLSSEPASVAG